MLQIGNLVIPIGGTGERFRTAGEKVPKPLIKIEGKTQLRWSVESSLNSYIPRKIILGVRSGLVELTYREIETWPRHWPETKVLDVGRSTLGAADTVSKTLSICDFPEESFVVADSDVFCDKLDFQNLSLIDWSGFVVSTESSNPAHSYVVSRENDIVLEIYEKQIVGNRGIAGHYGFRSLDVFKGAFNLVRKASLGTGELYMSKVSLQVAKMGLSKEIRSERVISIGTPVEVEQGRPKLRMLEQQSG